MKRIGITGHQSLSTRTAERVKARLAHEVSRRPPVCAVSSLARGADQLFSEEVLHHGGTLLAVIPSANYEMSFSDPMARKRYECLLQRSSEVIELTHGKPGQEAYWAAGRKVVDLADEMFAIWDGKKSKGLGGTADVVAYAQEHDVPVTVIWPSGSSRA